MRITCWISDIELETDDVRPIDGVEAECSKCGHTTESYGTDGPSVRRCLVLMHEECPLGHNNYYISDFGRDWEEEW
jgi:hypothetical protein